MALCEVCGKNSSERIISQIPMCASCFSDLQKIRGGEMEICDFYQNSFDFASTKARRYFTDLIIEKIESLEQGKRELAELQYKKELEIEKQVFANSFNEYYEYDVVTIINQDHGQVDKNNMISLLNERAQKGWKLHTVYSNELGKNALRILGFGVNATACEDVLIFERRIEKNP